jgi:hypothetical protein
VKSSWTLQILAAGSSSWACDHFSTRTSFPALWSEIASASDAFEADRIDFERDGGLRSLGMGRRRRSAVTVRVFSVYQLLNIVEGYSTLISLLYHFIHFGRASDA